MNRDVEDDRWIENDEEIEDSINEREERPVRRSSGTHKKKKRKHRRNGRWWRIPAVILIILVFCMMIFRVKTLRIEGNTRVSDEEVKELIHWDASQGNTLLLWLMNRKVDVSSNELLSRITVSVDNPQRVHVHVEEQLLVGCIKIGGQYFYINSEGMVVQSRTDKLAAVPLLAGLEVEKAETGSTLKAGSENVLDDILDIGEYLEHYQVTADSIEHLAKGGYKLQMGKVKVLLGRNIYMEEKLSELKDLLPQLKELSGTLHLEEYDSTKDSIIFTKDS